MNIFLDSDGKHVIVQRMEPVWNQMGHRVSMSPAKCDVQFGIIRFISKTNLTKVVRLDGVYYDADTNYNHRNTGLNQSHSIADGIVYQSLFSKNMCQKYLFPHKKEAITEVIYNGIDDSWSIPFQKHDGFNIVVISKWRRHKRLQEIIELFLEHYQSFNDSFLHIFGLLHDNKKVEHPNIRYYGMADRDVLKQSLSTMDLSLHFCKRDSCPNSMLETIGAGVPVITTNACGGATEMAHLTGGCIVCDGDSDFIEPDYPYRDSFNIMDDNLRKNILDNMKAVYADRRRVSVPDILRIEYTAKKYIEMFQKVIK
jgi:glycosyltransferase involved in cell wall biosynthesis